jgi:hypothetical protein
MLPRLKTNPPSVPLAASDLQPARKDHRVHIVLSVCSNLAPSTILSDITAMAARFKRDAIPILVLTHVFLTASLTTMKARAKAIDTR